MKTAKQIEFGDFQTPLTLAREVCQLLQRLGVSPEAVIEPTVGRGAFLVAAADTFPQSQLRGFDINPEYVQQTTKALLEIGAYPRASVIQKDFFSCDWEEELSKLSGHLLILGNPPWVTNAGVAAVNGSNLPAKENFLGLSGIAARTGKSNFDISEWMLIRLLRGLRGRAATFAKLCKTTTARKFLRYAWQNADRVADAAPFRIDAAKYFNAAVDACLLVVQTGARGAEVADVYDSLSATQPSGSIGLAGDDLVANIQDYRALQHLEGLSTFRWRSGVKHDCSDVMELYRTNEGRIKNNSGDLLSLEEEYLFPLLKCTDLARRRLSPKRLVIITQRVVGDDTSVIARTAPKTWSYLRSHRERLSARKSSIYKGRVPFSLFGIGQYAFAPWKVAVSGLHHSPCFQVIAPHDGKPVFFDDASYYLPLERCEDARLLADVLNSIPCQRFQATLIFPDSKRPVTVDLLQRLNLAAIAREAGLDEQWARLQYTGYGSVTATPQTEFVMEPR